jgi:hypothetical protein
MDISTILSLPKTSNAFTALKPTARVNSGSGSPPRKVARLHSDSDRASASRVTTGENDKTTLRVHITWDDGALDAPGCMA